MYLHLGQDTVILTDDILGVFDLDTSTISKHTRNYLAKEEKAGNVINVTYELPRSFIVCEDSKGNKKVYISQLSSQTLLKRKNKTKDFFSEG